MPSDADAEDSQKNQSVCGTYCWKLMMRKIRIFVENGVGNGVWRRKEKKNCRKILSKVYLCRFLSWRIFQRFMFFMHVRIRKIFINLIYTASCRILLPKSHKLLDKIHTHPIPFSAISRKKLIEKKTSEKKKEAYRIIEKKSKEKLLQRKRQMENI